MPSPRETLQARLLVTFRAEADEHLQAITQQLSALRQGLSAAETEPVLEAAFRAMHTLKGAARSVSLLDVEALCQACEAVLSRITRQRLPLTRPTLDDLEEATGQIARLVAGTGDPVAARRLAARIRDAAPPTSEAAGQAPAPPTPTPVAVPPTGGGDTIRVATARLDGVLFHAEDLLVPKLAAQERAREARDVADAIATCRGAMDGVAGTIPGTPASHGRAPAALAEARGALRALEQRARTLHGRLLADQRAMAAVTDGLLEQMRELRMFPAGSVLDVLPRIARDLAREQGKEVEWVEIGTELPIDRKVLEAIKDPLIHLVRNAVDHGLEPPEERARQGKPRQGRIALSVTTLDGGRVEVRLEDDGRGIDLTAVREAAVRARLLGAEQARSLSDDDALALVYRSGLSTNSMITAISGHGLGLAIARERVEAIDGRIEIQARRGVGTSVRMVLPSSIAVFRGLLVGAGTGRFLLPLEAVEQVCRVGAEDASTVEGREVVAVGGRAIPAAALGRVLGVPDPQRPKPADPRPCVVVKSGDAHAVLLVDEVIASCEGLVKALGWPLVRVPHVAAAGVLGTGEVVLILRPGDLIEAVAQGPAAAEPSVADESSPRAVILVVDDSITTRTMEKTLLEAAGYDVHVATDGVEAWTVLGSEAIDLVISDVDMPRIDGLELTAKIRADRRTAELPVVLVTALESREDKQRGIEVGANAYVVKSSFDQSNLLAIVRRLL